VSLFREVKQGFYRGVKFVIKAAATLGNDEEGIHYALRDILKII
jgi:hypothetical protein